MAIIENPAPTAGEDAGAIGLGWIENDHPRLWSGRRGVGEQDDIAGGEVEFWTGEDVGHGLHVVDRAIEVLEAAEFAAAIGAAGRMLGGGAGGLIGVDTDEEGALGLRVGERGEKQEEGEKAQAHGDEFS